MQNLLAQSQTINLTPSGTGFGGLTTLNFARIVSFAITAILVVAGLLFFFMLVIGGIKWIMSGGDKANTEAARNQITSALIGLVIVFAAWAILTLVGNIFGLGVLTNFTIPNI